MNKKEEEKILKLLEERKIIHYTELTEILNLGVESCRHKCIEFAHKYPENTEYKRGLLILKTPITNENLK